ncbi:MAG TPA: hypothetical protein VHR47_10095 [Bacillota bacterium]|nr:hypothetical protein [Bacillota bacterium]
MSCSYAERINSVKVMLTALKTDPTKLAIRGVSQEFIATMDTRYQAVQTLDAVHEAQKSQLKTTTAELNEQMDELEAMYKTVKKLIKIDLPKESWTGYGFTDKQ